ncbi:MAG: hypothetical protein D6800_10060 [Candidatus Zixiibacteriota bacterium]|nr:MAG: hypothetical protein D6800_10060 [candidate division Zixibacteria bacterium]
MQNNYQLLADLYRPNTDPSADLGATITVDTNTGEILGTSPSGGTVPQQNEPPVETTGAVSPQLPALRLIGRYGDLFLLFEHDGQLLIVDQHTAHERVLFEQVLAQMEAQAVVGQQLLLPVTVELTPEQLAVFEASEAVLKAAGFDIASFGGRTVKIEAVPSILARKSPERVLLKMLQDIESLKKTGYDLKKSIAQSMACRAAVMAGDRLSDREALGLVEALLCCENMLSCPHGRPTFIKITRDDLYRHFGRV